MASAGASEADGQVALAFALIERNQKIEQAPDFVDEPLRLGLRHHVLAHARINPGEGPQLGDEEWIRNEAHVEHDVHSDRLAVLVTERDDRHRHPRPRARAEHGRRDDLAQFVDRQRGGVDDAVGALAHLGQRETLGANALGDGGAARGHRMRPAALGIAAREHVVGGVEENYFGMNSGGVELREYSRPLRKEQALARIDSERDALERGIAPRRQHRDIGRQRDR